MSDFHHISVLLHETIDAMEINPDGIYVDCTLGGGGHSEEILKRLSPNGFLYGIDRDDEAIAAASARLAKYPNFKAIHANFHTLRSVAEEEGILGKADGVLFDLGVSSHQLDDVSRGFSYHGDAPLDMRMDRREEVSAKTLVNTLPESELARILRDYGEEKAASRIASFIVREREEKTIETTGELVDIISRAMPAKMKRDKHPAKRSFQAIRIAVNGELTGLPNALEAAYETLKPGGRLAVITFHSLEDRLTKSFLRDKEIGCTCPKEFPICVCGKKPKMQSVIRKPLEAGEAELEANPRARSAKLRVSEKTDYTE
ncbi:MAG: 16S rRNA (cytosine(1402)-N(4))-methyltransferase RsmH [Clostridia bacterium]|nr:16S rRNA (cytosine(1402)-N(4))-methyltransferase RsmH [Clostridia bacterium]